MEIIKDERKKVLYEILKDLYYLTEKGDLKNYNKLKAVHDKLLMDIFKTRAHGREGFEWDNARNGLDAVFMLEEKDKKKQLVIALKRIDDLKAYLI